MVGELVLDWMLTAFYGHVYDGGITKQEFGHSVHKDVKNKCLAFRPINGVGILCEPFFIEGHEGPLPKSARNPKGSVGIDVVITYKGKPVVGIELKTGKGMGKSGFATRRKLMGGTLIQITLKSGKS